MGAFKAGVQIVTFDEKDNMEAFNSTLKDSGARGLIFSPQTNIHDDQNTRQTFVQKLMPELQ